VITDQVHTTVLLAEAVHAVLTDPSGLYIDATYGRGGHSRLLLSKLSSTARLIAYDRDEEAVADGLLLAAQDARFSIRHSAFSGMRDISAASVTGVLMDLGISSPQIDNGLRGFSFMRDGPLDMRMDTTRGEPVSRWLATATEAHIAEVIHDYGEERHARRIAAAIALARTKKIYGEQGISRTLELAHLVAGCVHGREAGQHPATRTFQAFRIFINDELGELERTLAASLGLLAPQGRLAVISFHSLEDRRVKQFIAQHSKEHFDPRSPQSVMRNHDPSGATQLPLIDLGRIKPSAAEIKHNPRSRSAVLRTAQRTGAPV
jgi:16S rRNA (cytosine1402-N4)-methyltransferase